MKRISTILAIGAVVATGFVSSASAQAFSAGWGTGNVSSSYYGTDGRLHAGNSNVQPNQVAADRNGLNAFASAPASDRATIAAPTGSAGYNELLATH